MFILNLQACTALKSFTPPAKGVVVHVHKRAELDKLELTALLKIHNGLVPDTEALSADSAPSKVATSLWEVLTTNQEVFAVEAPAVKSTAEKVKAERKTHGQTAAQARKEAKPKVVKRGTRASVGAKPMFDGDAKIKLLVKENPRREGTRAHKVYGLYGKCKTVAEFIAKGGGYGDLRWDIERKHVTVGK